MNDVESTWRIQQTHPYRIAIMPDLTQLTIYFAAALVLALTPGPGIFYVAARTLAEGRRAGTASSFGTGLGGMVHVLAGSLGVSAIVLASAELFTALKLIGATYLAWIGLRTIMSAREEASAVPVDGRGTPPVGTWLAFREGVLVEALNPKTAAFFLALVPQFVDPLRGSISIQFLVLGSVSVVLNTMVDLVVAISASRIRGDLTEHPTLIRRLRQGSGGMMVALGVGLAFARRPKI